jgi:hypothetical protein
MLECILKCWSACVVVLSLTICLCSPERFWCETDQLIVDIWWLIGEKVIFMFYFLYKGDQTFDVIVIIVLWKRLVFVIVTLLCDVVGLSSCAIVRLLETQTRCFSFDSNYGFSIIYNVCNQNIQRVCVCVPAEDDRFYFYTNIYNIQRQRICAPNC